MVISVHSAQLGLFISGVKYVKLMKVDQGHIMEWKSIIQRINFVKTGSRR